MTNAALEAIAAMNTDGTETEIRQRLALIIAMAKIETTK
jgi:hypothetical protein